MEDRLQSSEPEVRRQAVCDIPSSGGEEALSLLMIGLADENWRVRKESVRRVECWPGVANAVRALVATIAVNDDVGLRNASLSALAGIGQPAIHPLISVLKETPQHHIFLIQALGDIGEPAAINELMPWLDNEDVNLQVATVEALASIGGSSAEKVLLSLLDKKEDTLLKLAVLDSLVTLESQIPVENIVGTLSETLLKKSALRLLGFANSIEAFDPLCAALAGKQKNLHSVAALGIANLMQVLKYEDQAVHSLQQLSPNARDNCLSLFSVTQRRDASVARAAAMVLGVSKTSDAVEVLIQGMTNPRVSSACANALSFYGESSKDAVINAAKNADRDTMVEVCTVIPLMGLKGPEIERLLVQAIQDRIEDEDLAASAARCLGNVLDENSTRENYDILNEALNDDECPTGASAAAIALGRVHSRGVFDDARTWLVKGLKSEYAEVRAASAKAMGKVVEPEIFSILADQLTDEDS